MVSNLSSPRILKISIGISSKSAVAVIMPSHESDKPKKLILASRYCCITSYVRDCFNDFDKMYRLLHNQFAAYTKFRTDEKKTNKKFSALNRMLFIFSPPMT